MGNIVVGRYGPNEGTVEPDGSIRQNWQGWIEPEDLSWIAFIDMEGKPTFFLNRDENGGVIDAAA